MLALFDVALREHCGLSYQDCGEAEGALVYIDDAVYTGMHVLNDLTPTIAGGASALKHSCDRLCETQSRRRLRNK